MASKTGTAAEIGTTAAIMPMEIVANSKVEVVNSRNTTICIHTTPSSRHNSPPQRRSSRNSILSRNSSSSRSINNSRGTSTSGDGDNRFVKDAANPCVSQPVVPHIWPHSTMLPPFPRIRTPAIRDKEPTTLHSSGSTPQPSGADPNICRRSQSPLHPNRMDHPTTGCEEQLHELGCDCAPCVPR